MFGQRQIDPQPATHYRSSRLSAVNGQYFFATREGTLEGPFMSRHDAEQSINRYIERVTVVHHGNEPTDTLQRRAAIKHSQEP